VYLLSSAYGYIFIFYAQCYRISTSEYGASFIYTVTSIDIANTKIKNTDRDLSKFSADISMQIPNPESSDHFYVN